MELVSPSSSRRAGAVDKIVSTLAARGRNIVCWKAGVALLIFITFALVLPTQCMSRCCCISLLSPVLMLCCPCRSKPSAQLQVSSTATPWHATVPEPERVPSQMHAWVCPGTRRYNHPLQHVASRYPCVERQAFDLHSRGRW